MNTSCASSAATCTSALGYCGAASYCVACTADADCGSGMMCASAANVVDYSTGSAVTTYMGQCYTPTCNQSSIAGSQVAGYCESLNGSSNADYMQNMCNTTTNVCEQTTCTAATQTTACYSGTCIVAASATDGMCGPCTASVGCNGDW